MQTTRLFSSHLPYSYRALAALCVIAMSVSTQTQFAQLSRLDWPNNVAESARIDVADIDLDGAMDLVIARSNLGSIRPIQLLHNDGYGNFTDISTTLPAPGVLKSWNIQFALLDGDPWPDIVFTGLGKVQVLLHSRVGTKYIDVSATNLPVHSGDYYGLAVGDVDGDGDNDIVLGDVGAGPNLLFVNDGTGKFTSVNLPTTPGGKAWSLSLADVDGDKDLDIFVSISGATRSNGLFLNNGKGVFQDVTTQRLPALGGAARKSIPFDADGDGDIDVWYARYKSSDVLLINDGTGKFTDESAQRTPLVVSGSYGGTAADVDEDGDLDILIANWSASFNETIQLYLNNGKGVFTNAVSRVPSKPINALDVVAIDIDNDQDLDFAFTHWGARDGVYVNLEGQLYADNAPTIGTTWAFDMYARPGYASLSQVCGVFLGVNNLTPRVPTPWGRLGIQPPLFVGPSFVLTPPGGKSTIQLPIPNQASLRGATLWWQGIHVHAPIDTRLTNVWFERIP
ncbi:MAG: VCBS repeat-containing protein [Planctomycetes bacterium]|nr:VCBS repeat-containing protein [Planctomycetota bacterium]